MKDNPDIPDSALIEGYWKLREITDKAVFDKDGQRCCDSGLRAQLVLELLKHRWNMRHTDDVVAKLRYDKRLNLNRRMKYNSVHEEV